MELNLLTIIYLVGSITFIMGLKMLSNPVSARKGNRLAGFGMAIAIAGTIFLYEHDGEKLHNYIWIFSALLVGAIIGSFRSSKFPAVLQAIGRPMDRRREHWRTAA